MNDNVFKAALAGLLHDIGKFAQRAAEGTHIQWDDEAKKEFKYQHALHTDQVVAQIVPDQWREAVRAAAGRHHKPQTHLDRVVTMADRLSAGERADESKDHPKQLQSIFCRLTGLNDEAGKPISAPAAKYLPLKKLAIEESVIFPVETINDSHGTYKELWDEFAQEAAALKIVFETDGADKPAYLESLLNLMRQYTWCIPSAYYKSVPDVSLYDHSRMTAALAACLAEQPAEKVQAWFNKEATDEPVALLVGGDISGVQKFIYTIASTDAAKSLRGRSFYLQLLTEVVAHYVLEQLDLPTANLIYAGGGNFFLLAPLGSSKDDLRKISRDVTERLLNAHNGDLHLILANTSINTVQFKRKNFHKAWSQLHQQLNKAKLQPMVDLLTENLAEEIGFALGEGGDTDRQCKVCGREVTTDERVEVDDDGNRTCNLCQSFAKLGNALPKATHFVTLYSESKDHRNINKWWKGLETFGVNVWVVDAKLPPPTGSTRYISLPQNLRLVEVAQLPDDNGTAKYTNTLQQELNQIDCAVVNTFRLFAQLAPLDEKGNPKTFDKLAEDASGGFKRWGVLRMDVDNLGKLFEQGFSKTVNGAIENRLTLSRLAQLSFGLRLFFEGWLPNLADTDEDRLYIQYAGGDDLFVVGSWDALPPFAARIRESFDNYVANNPAITLSGGVVLAAEKYPLYHAAHNAEQAEHKAKAFVRPKTHNNAGRTKDAFCFLEQVVAWEDFGEIEKRAQNLKAWCGEDGPVSRGLLQNLLSIYLEYKRGRDEALRNKQWDRDKPYVGPWMWHLAYQLARRREGKNTPDAVKDELLKMEDEILSSQEAIEAIGLAARWAQYLIRK